MIAVKNKSSKSAIRNMVER